MQDLNVALLQANLVWEDKQANLQKLEQMLEKVPDDVHLVMLPEMFSTGFSMKPEAFAEPEDGPAVQWLQEQAARARKVLTGSLIIEEGGRYYNRLFWMRPDGSYETYSKRHLFSMAGEEKHYAPGQDILITELNGWRICPMVCYDLRFPVWTRNVQDYHVLLFVANWPERRVKHWQVLLQARAIENQCYCLGVNRVGEDGNGVDHSGHSGAYSPAGEELAFASHQETVLLASLDWQAMQKVRRYMPFLQDRDRFDLREG